MKRFSLFAVAALAALAVITALNFFWKVQAQSDILLFSPVRAPQVRNHTDKTSLASVRESEIVFYTQSLTGSEQRLKFTLFDGRQHEAAKTEAEIRSPNDLTWRGKITGDKFSGDVILTFKNGFVSGLIYTQDAVYEIVPRGQKHILVELDQSLFPECGGEIIPEKNETGRENPAAAVGVDSGDRIDVLVVYTTATKNFLGGDAQAQVLAQQAIDSTNTSYLNSKIRQRVRMVHAQEYVYTETTSASTDLSNLRSNADIQALRNTHKADLVAMIGEISGACGVGYLMGAPSGNQNTGYTVTARSCAVGNLSFAHELGHNMGSQHNPENGSGATFPYGYGHYVNGVFRTVMSYVDPCSSGCTRRPYFSNPAIFFSGFPAGTELRNNARSINNTADVVANYRYSGASLTLNSYNGGETIPRNITRTLDWASDSLAGNVRIEISRDASTSWQTLITETPNDGSEVISITGKPTRQARIRIVSLENPAVSDSSVNNISIR